MLKKILANIRKSSSISYLNNESDLIRKYALGQFDPNGPKRMSLKPTVVAPPDAPVDITPTPSATSTTTTITSTPTPTPTPSSPPSLSHEEKKGASATTSNKVEEERNHLNKSTTPETPSSPSSSSPLEKE